MDENNSPLSNAGLGISATTTPVCASGAAASVSIAQDARSLTFTAPASSSDTTCTFAYTVTDPTGLTGTATVSVTVNQTLPLGSTYNPAPSGIALRDSGQPSGFYWVRPAGHATAYYTHVDNDNQGGGWVLVAQGGASNDWWNPAGYISSPYRFSEDLTTSALTCMPDAAVNALMGGDWTTSRGMWVNRRGVADSLFLRVSSGAFTWAAFPVGPGASTPGDIKRYSTAWGGGSLSYSLTGTTSWTE